MKNACSSKHPLNNFKRNKSKSDKKKGIFIHVGKDKKEKTRIKSLRRV